MANEILLIVSINTVILNLIILGFNLGFSIKLYTEFFKERVKNGDKKSGTNNPDR
jgi:hypothetical protein